jgi:prepilin-type N-terminal cleavage/methylation domain-containing protein
LKLSRKSIRVKSRGFTPHPINPIVLTRGAGFTLIEVLISLVILSISLLAMAGLMATTTRNNASGGHLTEAATFAQDLLEKLRMAPLGSIPVNTTVFPDQVPDPPVPSLGSTGITYTRSYFAVPNIPAPNNTLDIITITVTWTDTTPHLITMVSAIPL